MMDVYCKLLGINILDVLNENPPMLKELSKGSVIEIFKYCQGLGVDGIAITNCIGKLANNCNVPITFRAAGTSLSGQAITDSVLIMLSTDWNGFEIEKDGLRIRLQPGIIGADANHHLLPINVN